MNTNYFELKELLRNARRALEQERDEIQSFAKKVEQMDTFLQLLNARDGLLSEHERLQEETDSLRAQLQEREVQLSELRKLTTGMAKKSSEEDLQKALRTYFNTSKRKTIGKRVAVKTVITEFISTMKITLPDDLAEALEHLDDEQGEPQIVIERAEDVIASGGMKNVKIA